MASDIEEQKKVLLPILQVGQLALCHSLLCPPPTAHCLTLCLFARQQRATEIESMEPRVAYYCRLYALKRVSV
jgi:hypothetical protein